MCERRSKSQLNIVRFFPVGRPALGGSVSEGPTGDNWGCGHEIECIDSTDLSYGDLFGEGRGLPEPEPTRNSFSRDMRKRP